MEFSAAHIQALVLGLVEGLTEFIPVSSTGHLVLVREIFGWQDQGIFFDMIIQLATLFAVVVYFWNDWVSFAKSLMAKPSQLARRADKESRRLAVAILIANIPTMIAALILMGFIETDARRSLYVAALTLLVGILFLVVERISRPNRDLSRLTIYDAVSVGLAQAAAVIPGVSRSGATISAGIYQGLKRDEAARLSFLVGAPAIFLSGTYSIVKFLKEPASVDWTVLGIAFLVAFISGYAAIRFMLTFLKNHDLKPFAYYRIVVGAILLLIILFNVRLPWLS